MRKQVNMTQKTEKHRVTYEIDIVVEVPEGECPDEFIRKNAWQYTLVEADSVETVESVKIS